MTVTINPGELRTSITLQTPSISTDAGGFKKTTYTNAGTDPVVYARWINSHGQEQAENAVKNVQRATVTIRNRTDVKTTWQVLKDSEAWNIISIDAIRGENRFIELVVERAKATV